MRLFLLNFAVGVVTGIPLEFQFGTNWTHFARAGGDIFGHLLGFEAAMAFMLEATFLGIMAFGWQRVPPAMHLFATGMVALGASLSAFWIMVANSWMQTPTGGTFINGAFVLDGSICRHFQSRCLLGGQPHVVRLSGDLPLRGRRHQCLVPAPRPTCRFFPALLSK